MPGIKEERRGGRPESVERMTRFGRLLRPYMDRMGFSQRYLAVQANVPVGTFHRYIKGKADGTENQHSPPSDVVAKVARIVGCTADDLT